ncbi:MAG: GFA family protein [Solirubrobacteraceae bacterium]
MRSPTICTNGSRRARSRKPDPGRPLGLNALVSARRAQRTTRPRQRRSRKRRSRQRRPAPRHDRCGGVPERRASGSCGQLQAVVTGDPVRDSICHCLACQRRTGSSYGYQARFPAQSVTISGRFKQFIRHSDEDAEIRRFQRLSAMRCHRLPYQRRF